MGIMQFESWQARGFGVPVLGRSGAGRGERFSQHCPGALSGKPVPSARSQDWSFQLEHYLARVYPEFIVHLLCAECCARGQGAFGSDQGQLPALRDLISSGGAGKSIDDSEIQPREALGDSAVGLRARLRVTGGLAGVRKDTLCFRG